MTAKLRELLERRNTLINDGRKLYDKIDLEKRAMTAEEKVNDEKRFAEIADLKDQISRMERQLELDREAAAAVATATREAGNVDQGARDVSHRSRLVAHAERLSRLCRVTGAGDARSVSFMDKVHEARAGVAYADHFETYLRGEMSEKEFRGQQADLATAGGYLMAPVQMLMDLIKAVDDLVFIRKWATKFIVTTADGLGMPSLDADVADADWTPELGTGSETEMQLGKRELKPYAIAKRIKVSNKLIRTSAMDVETLVRQRLGYKFGVTEEKAFLLGSGAMQPLGLFTASADGIPTTRDVLSGSATDITADGLFNTKYSLKSPYLADPSCRWVFHRDGVLKIAKLKDSQNRYLWEPSLQAGQPDRLLNLPLESSEFVPNTFTAGLYVGMLGAFKHYYVADSLGLTVQRLTELYAETNQVGFIGRAEVDGMPVLAEAFARVRTN